MSPAAEFSHKVTVDPWPKDGIVIDLSASAEEREALRARSDIVELPSLRVAAAIERSLEDLVLAGRIEAVVAQTCVVTLKPVTSSLDVPFERRFRRPAIHKKMVEAGQSLDLDDDDIDILEGDEIDVGDVIAEEFCLALDPYPRHADADQVLDEIRTKTGTMPDERPENPFEKLRRH